VHQSRQSRQCHTMCGTGVGIAWAEQGLGSWLLLPCILGMPVLRQHGSIVCEPHDKKQHKVCQQQAPNMQVQGRTCTGLKSHQDLGHTVQNARGSSPTRIWTTQCKVHKAQVPPGSGPHSAKCTGLKSHQDLDHTVQNAPLPHL